MFPWRIFVAVLASSAALIGYLQQHDHTPIGGHLPYMETPAGYPVNQTELWRIRVCHAHHRLIKRDPYSHPPPPHSVLGLDANSKPFDPPSSSATPKRYLYHEVHATVADATWRAIGTKMQRMAANLNNLKKHGVNFDRDWMDIVLSVVSLLGNDEIRGHYTHHFVPALTGGGTMGEKLKTYGMIRKMRIRALEELCA
ncbi:hypothetical protein FALBO_3531 [Fusarium albosuccineum]|uniref:Uncharacterized protein n=1 Tax=Fusarium albosuccineum TaxID=1237068 RepID=A0A8H4LLD1_9HYPO|nr:hypothetical protein FALBO_3531 [Fusarium albosuccineum]